MWIAMSRQVPMASPSSEMNQAEVTAFLSSWHEQKVLLSPDGDSHNLFLRIWGKSVTEHVYFSQEPRHSQYKWQASDIQLPIQVLLTEKGERMLMFKLQGIWNICFEVMAYYSKCRKVPAVFGILMLRHHTPQCDSFCLMSWNSQEPSEALRVVWLKTIFALRLKLSSALPAFGKHSASFFFFSFNKSQTQILKIFQIFLSCCPWMDHFLLASFLCFYFFNLLKLHAWNH